MPVERFCTNGVYNTEQRAVYGSMSNRVSKYSKPADRAQLEWTFGYHDSRFSSPGND